MKLRFLVEILVTKRWCRDEDSYLTNRTEQRPVLQYLDDTDNKWKKIPIVKEEVTI